MLTINIYKDNVLQRSLKDQENDANALGLMLRLQSNSTSWAIKYEGWKVELIDNETGEKEYWKG